MKHIHFIGICGVAMSALATAFQKIGWDVSGSDAGFFPPISTYLKEHGISFYPGWHPDKMIKNGTPDMVVVGNVANSTNPELLYAQENGIPFYSYPEVIAEYIVQEQSIVCAGTYGKTTIAALLALILEKAGYDPMYMFGGLCPNFNESARIKQGGVEGWSVLEGDEYRTARWDTRPKFKFYSPTHLLLTSVVWDHADIFPTEEDYRKTFRDLISMLPERGLLVACINDPVVNELAISDNVKAPIISYGSANADYIYAGLKQSDKGIHFTIQTSHGNRHEINSPLLGEHAAENICGSFAMAKEIGINDNIILAAIAEFRGIRRRLEKRYEGAITVFDDLAHSPAKARTALKTLRETYATSHITAIFEPNTGNRKSAAIPGYGGAFQDADEVIIPQLTKVKIDSRDVDPPFDGRKLAEVIGQTHKNARYLYNDEMLLNYVQQKIQPDDVVVFLGSHGFRGMIEGLIAKFQ